MAQGTLTLFEEFALNIGDGTHDMDGDTFKIALITTLPTAADATPALGDYTEVSGAGYTAGGETLTTTYTETGGTATFATNGATITWTQNGSGPTNIVAGLIYNDTAAGDPAVCFIDFTTDSGTTPVSLQDGDITWTAEATLNRIFELS
jgi:hypothetical protein